MTHKPFRLSGSSLPLLPQSALLPFRYPSMLQAAASSCWMLLLLAALLHAGPVWSSEPVVPPSLTVTIAVPQNPDLPEAGRFIPVETPLLVSIALDERDQLPAGYSVAVRVIGHDGVEYHRRSWPVQSETGLPIKFERLFRITGLPGSRKIRVQAAIVDPGGRAMRSSSGAADGWQDIFDGYGLHSGLAWSRGWHPQENVDHMLRGCTGRGILHCARPVFPVVFRVRGNAPVKCFEDGRWTLEIDVNRTTVHTQVVDRNEFEAVVPIDPAIEMPDCRSPYRSWPVGEMELAIVSDQTFEPKVCEGVEDSRVLAFHVTHLEMGDWLPLEGFRGPREADGCYWPAPDCSVLVPGLRPGTRLLVQGRRDVQCMETPQTVTVAVNGQDVGTLAVSGEHFVMSVLAEDIPASEHGKPMMVRITVSPIFFRTQCRDTDDPNPYGVGIDEIAVR